MSNRAESVQNQSQQYFTFMLAGEEYGIDILKILEIRTLERLTVLPGAPSFVKGVMNLRGAIIPILDLRELFMIEPVAYNRSTIIIILQIKTEEHSQVVGIIVDAFSDVDSIDPTKIKPKPDITDLAGQEFILGLANVHLDQDKNKLIILLDVDSLLNKKEWEKVNVDYTKENSEEN